jgi:toxin secretion/phage lysis holin
MTLIGAIFHNFIAGLKIKACLAGILTFICYSLGYNYLAIEVMAYLVVIDVILGIMGAIKMKRFNSYKLMKGMLLKILLYFLLIVAAYQATRLPMMPNWIYNFMALLIALTELKSILENAKLLDFKWAKVIEDKINGLISEKLK